MSIGVAIVGSGIFVKEEHLPAIDACKYLVLKAVYSRTSKNVQGLLEGRQNVDAYSDDAGTGKGFKDLLGRSDIQAVVIALPILAQPEYIKAALLASKHVLSEKPIAENVALAAELIQWYKSTVDTSKVFWSVAENCRFMNSFDHAAKEISKLGRLLTFRCRDQVLVAGGRYYETEWRKAPGHQGGFLLDGGVHTMAVLRLVLGKDHITRLASFSRQNQKHLPPVDSVEATVKTASGAIGSISLSYGTTAKGREWILGCEKGSVLLGREKVTITIDGKEEVKDVPDERSGVPPEIRAWAKSIAEGKADSRQSPEEALGDLELIQALLESGAKDGAPVDLVHQARGGGQGGQGQTELT